MVRVALTAAVAILALAAGCGGDSPDEAVTGFADAIADEDFEGACDYLSADIQEAPGGDCPAALESALTEADIDQAESLEAEVVEESDDAATVESTTEGEQPEQVDLVKEDGEWKIAGLP